MRKRQIECMVPDNLLSEFNEYLKENMGLYYPERAWLEFEKKIPEITESFGFKDQCEGIKWIINQHVTKDLISSLAEHLTIGETYFFRDKNTFDLIENKILKPLIYERREKKQKQIKIWCAACCTGEEPYTLAMILSEMLPNIKNWNISIIGSDINIEFLRRAKKGIYREWSLRSIPDHYLKKYFNKQDSEYSINPSIKKMVRFCYVNLVEDLYPSLTNSTSNVDIILCNNVLIYFSKEQIKKVVKQLDKSLVDGGYLSVTAIEASYVNIPSLTIQSGIACNVFRSKKIGQVQKSKSNNSLLFSISRDLKNNNTRIKKKSHFLENPLTNLLVQDEKEKSIQSASHSDNINENTILSYAKELSNNGEYERLIKLLEEHLSTNQVVSSQVPLMKILIKAHVNLVNFDQARYWCEKSILIDNTNPSLHYLHAAVYQEFNCIDAALNSLKKSIFLDGDFVIAYFTIGNIMLSLDNLYEARRNFRNVMITLDKLDNDSVLPEADELTAGRLKEIVRNILNKL